MKTSSIILREAKQSLSLTVPLLLSEWLYALNFFVITWISAQLSHAALAAIALVQSIYFFLLMMISGISAATAILVAQDLGAKNTDGIYERDPNVPDDRLDELGLKHENRPIRFLYANQVDTRIKRISIESDGRVTDEHLIETAALKPFIELKYPITIQIVDGTKPDKLITALEGNVATGSYILKP